jgi:hypothetical protein
VRECVRASVTTVFSIYFMFHDDIRICFLANKYYLFFILQNNLYTWLYIPKNTSYRLILKDTRGNHVPTSEIASINISSNETTVLLARCMYGSGNYCRLVRGNYSINITVSNAKQLVGLMYDLV